MLQKQKEKGVIKEIEGSRWVTFRGRTGVDWTTGRTATASRGAARLGIGGGFRVEDIRRTAPQVLHSWHFVRFIPLQGWSSGC